MGFDNYTTVELGAIMTFKHNNPDKNETHSIAGLARVQHLLDVSPCNCTKSIDGCSACFGVVQTQDGLHIHPTDGEGLGVTQAALSGWMADNPSTMANSVATLVKKLAVLVGGHNLVAELYQFSISQKVLRTKIDWDTVKTVALSKWAVKYLVESMGHLKQANGSPLSTNSAFFAHIKSTTKNTIFHAQFWGDRGATLRSGLDLDGVTALASQEIAAKAPPPTPVAAAVAAPTTNSELSLLIGAVGTVNSAVSKVNSTVGQLAGVVETHGKDISVLQASDATNKKNISVLQASDASNTKQIAVLQDENVKVKSSVASQKIQISELQISDVANWKQTRTNTEGIRTLQASNKKTSDRVATNTESIQAIAGDMWNMTNTVRTLQQKLHLHGLRESVRHLHFTETTVQQRLQIWQCIRSEYLSFCESYKHVQGVDFQPRPLRKRRLPISTKKLAINEPPTTKLSLMASLFGGGEPSKAGPVKNRSILRRSTKYNVCPSASHWMRDFKSYDHPENGLAWLNLNSEYVKDDNNSLDSEDGKVSKVRFTKQVEVQDYTVVLASPGVTNGIDFPVVNCDPIGEPYKEDLLQPGLGQCGPEEQLPRVGLRDHKKTLMLLHQPFAGQPDKTRFSIDDIELQLRAIHEAGRPHPYPEYGNDDSFRVPGTIGSQPVQK